MFLFVYYFLESVFSVELQFRFSIETVIESNRYGFQWRLVFIFSIYVSASSLFTVEYLNEVLTE